MDSFLPSDTLKRPDCRPRPGPSVVGPREKTGDMVFDNSTERIKIEALRMQKRPVPE
ncbi:protein of unknown function [Azospirillum lipoferum 4B]|uniref:Uncharacterized protein n=1 Tax=Azospirillum lipoferum (strain 4B) TaxID=862719 RepID=G7Z760_AZOL4|nr:protein of unknown function [Azospirillum lipoferum 4B]